MTVSQTLRFLLKKYSSGGDPHPSRTEFNTMIDAIENNGAMFSQGVTGSRPPAGKRGRWYWDEDAERMYYDNGTAWKDQNPNGGGGGGKPIVPGATASEGVSTKAARADHTHTLPLASATADGALSKADKAKLDGATSIGTPGALVRYSDGGGLFSVATPTSSAHPTTKAYVDGKITTIGDAAADYADAAITAAPNATATAAGKMSAADKAKLNAATAASTVSTIVMRDGNGAINIQAQSLPGHAARKDYVDTAVGAKADAGHTHTKITQGLGDLSIYSGGTGAYVYNGVTRFTIATDGRINSATAPSLAGDLTNKAYVDAQIAALKTQLGI